MGEIKGFLKHSRTDFSKEAVAERIQHYNEFIIPLDDDELKNQGARCMNCGVPFCHSGCPVDNLIPEWNDLVYNNDWKEAVNRLKKTNNFPEFTGRVCPAPCENSCVLAINQPAVTIKNIEKSIIDKAYEENWIKPNKPEVRTGKNVAVVGSGPSGLACADQLNQAGHFVTVFEKNEVIGGLLVLGIPDFKLEKSVVQRRVDIMKAEGVEFKTNTNVGKDIKLSELKEKFDAVVLCGGAEQPRDLPVSGRELKGVHFAMEFLTQQNRRNGNREITVEEISAKDKNVIVIGGGDTGSDCIGTSIRQGAKSVTNLELLPKPPSERTDSNPWPQWAFIERTSTSHEEGCKRIYSVLTKELVGENGVVKKLKGIELEWSDPDAKTGRRNMKEIEGSEFELDADLVLLAMGFTGPKSEAFTQDIGIELDARSNIQANTQYMTNVDGIFAAGDMRRGQSLVVWAISEGRKAAKSVTKYLSK